MKSLLRRLRRGRPLVVVSGLPRSGTSMAMQMLAAGGMAIFTDGTRAADENNPLGYFELERVKTLPEGGSTRWLAGARGKAIKIVSPLLTYVPECYDYQVVFMRRDLDEVMASQNAMLDALRQPRGPADDRLRAQYVAHLDQVERFLALRACFTTLAVDYASAVAHPREEAARIAAFLGGGLSVPRMAAVATAGLYRRRQRGPGFAADPLTSADSS